MKLLYVPILRSGPNLTKVIGLGLHRPKHRAGLSCSKRTEHASWYKRTEHASRGTKESSIRKYYREPNTGQYKYYLYY